MSSIEVQPDITTHLRSSTQALHQSLDQQVMAFDPFQSREHYAVFLRMQLRLHAAGQRLYQDSALQEIFAGLSEWNRLPAVQQDCVDLGISEADINADMATGADVPLGSTDERIGWLYTIEGSNMGAAVLLKRAKKKLALSEEFGAHHMAAHLDGRGKHWMVFKTALNDVSYTDSQCELMVAGASSAFRFVIANANQLMDQ